MPPEPGELQSLALTVRAAVDVLEAAGRKAADLGFPPYLQAPIAKATFHANLAAAGLEVAAEPPPLTTS